MGRDGLLRLGFACRDGRTVLRDRRYRLPLQALEPMSLDASGGLTLMLLNPTGGMLGGDVLDTRVSLDAGCRVCLATPSAARVYRTAGPPAVQRFAAEIGEGAALEYVPDHLIPSPGARLVQSTELRLARGALAIVLDGWAVGRIARGERWRFSSLDLALVARDDQGPLLKDRALLAGRPDWDRLGGAEGRSYVGTFLAVAPGREGWQALADELTAMLDGLDGVIAGIAPLARGGVFGRILSPSAPLLRGALDLLWAGSRRALLGLPPLDLRRP